MSFIDEFESHYDYDCNYMRILAKNAPKAFEAFVGFLPMGKVGESLPADILWTAKTSAMLTEDCGACVQLNIRMALESGVDSELLKKIVKKPESLDDKYGLVYKFAKMVAENSVDSENLLQRMRDNYSEVQLAELSVAIASTKVYPTIKRALGEFENCRLISFSFNIK